MTIAKVYGLALQSILNKEVDFDSDTVKCLLTTSTYVPNQDTHRYRNQLTNEVTGTNYTTGGVTVSGKTVTYNTATNTLMLDATVDPSFTSVTIASFRYAIFYIDTGSSATSPLLAYIDFEADFAAAAQDVTIVLPATGIMSLTAA